MSSRPRVASLAGDYFLPWGRIRRLAWVVRLVLLGLVCIGLGLLLQQALGDRAQNAAAVVFVAGALCLTAKRLHDAGTSGWWLLLLLVPILGPLAILVLALRKGMRGRNAYGADPVDRRDYLTVDIAAT
jgi:uncharacterized membrane protein YhaH (DUF805 family)